MATSISSGVLSSDTLIFNGRNRVNAVTVLTDGTNAATVELRDGTTASGTVKITGKCLGANLVNHIIFENPVLFETGLFADLTGTGATCIVFFGG
jgi:hypothetical protein